MLSLLTGGSGLLGTELQKHMAFYAPSHGKLDITKKIKDRGEYAMIIHAAAYTNVAKAEIDRDKCFAVNVTGTLNLLTAFPNTPFIYISSEYGMNPVNTYAKSKRIGEEIVWALAPHYLIIRTLFKPTPFPYPRAFVDQWTEGDYVDVIAEKIITAINEWDKITAKTITVGTGRKTIYELARRTCPTVQPMSILEIKDVVLPADYL